jgi:flavin-dependent dehydrogenase
MTPADAVVVGGGPAGAATALLLARAGHNVMLIDRAAFPRAKPCGDCLSLGANALLEQLGVLDAVRAAPHMPLDGWRIVAPDGRAFEARFETASAIAIERAVLDAVLVDAARGAGVRVVRDHVTDVLHEGSRVCGVGARDAAYPARLVIGADGLRSVVAARLRLRRPAHGLRKLSLTFHVADMPLDAIGEMHVGDGFCAGIAPVSERRCNLTVVADADRYGRALGADPAGAAFALLDRLTRMRGRVELSALRAAPRHASGPFHRTVSRVAVDGCVLVGDAAGYYDPFTGQGVYQALASALLLARAADAALRTDRITAASFARYARERARMLRAPRLVQRAIETVLARPALANRAIARIADAHPFAHAILAVTGDVEPASSLLSPRALSSLLLPSRPENAA